MIADLTDRSVIALSGADVLRFAQGLFTNDIEALTPERPSYGAILTPQGKVWCDFLIFVQGDALLLDVQAARCAPLCKRLAMYRLRAAVTIASRDDLRVHAAWEDDLPEAAGDPRLPSLGRRALLPARHDSAVGADAYRMHRLALGVPEGDDFGQGALFALEAGLDALGAISFAKGCYVGQELTARMKHRAKDHKRLLPVSADAPLTVGDTVQGDTGPIGTVISSYGTQGFALLRWSKDASRDVAIGPSSAKILPPDWLFS